MAWVDDLLVASYRGLSFECLAVDDEFEKSLVLHRYPYRAGADIEDMGRGPREISVKAFFWGDTYKDAVVAFVAALEMPGSGPFIHPVFGLVANAQVASGSISQDAEGVDQASVSFNLVESTTGNPFFTTTTANQQASAVGQKTASARAASGFTVAGLITQLQALNPLSQLTALRQSIMGPILQMKALAGAVITAGLDVINFPLSFVSDLTSLASGVANVGGFSVSNLLGGYMQAFSRLMSVVATGSTVTSIGSNAPTEASVVQAVAVHVAVEQACSVADAAAAVLQSETLAPSLSPVDIETMTNSARGQIEAVIVLVSASYTVELARPIIESLKDVAFSVQQAAQAVIVARPPLINRVVESPVCLHLLAFWWYGDHTRADELQRLNALALPNFLSPGQTLECYAK